MSSNKRQKDALIIFIISSGTESFILIARKLQILGRKNLWGFSHKKTNKSSGRTSLLMVCSTKYVNSRRSRYVPSVFLLLSSQPSPLPPC